ncbi:HoxN/HupN/NixA family nickel/cobalt transporter [Dermatophilaceae bacterium Soc4.6]
MPIHVHPQRTRWRREDWLEVAAYGTVIVLMHVVGFGLLVFVVAPQHLAVGTQVFGVGLGVTAYVFGLRHALDADHIAAIDNTTRKLMAEGGQPRSVGFWFAMGHSGMVFVLTGVLAFGSHAAATLSGNDSGVHIVLSTLGTVASGGFLLAMGLFNLIAFLGIWRVFRSMRHGPLDDEALERHLASRGLIVRLLGRIGQSIRHPWQMLPVGMLFGVGFDTASEVTVLVLAGMGAAAGLPWYGVLLLPLLFAAGMSALDFLDGLFMTVAYDWAFSHPVRKIYYNLSVTGLSVAVALVIGSIELVSVLRERFGVESWATDWIAGIDLGNIGVLVVALFVMVWAVAVSYWRWGRVEERWARAADPGRQARRD